MISEPCLSEAQAVELGALLRKVEDLMDMPVEIEWAMDDAGFKLLQGRPLHTEPSAVPDAVWMNRPRLNGTPRESAGATGRACVINCECEWRVSRQAMSWLHESRVRR
jgi:phosphoenolpyruvate synthase/pyruvate phosphate dikinase